MCLYSFMETGWSSRTRTHWCVSHLEACWAVWSWEKDRKSFHKVHKHNAFIHLLKKSKFLNPKLQWWFKAEDFVGHCSKLWHSVSMGVGSTRLSLKIANKYRVFQHLLLTRKKLLLLAAICLAWSDLGKGSCLLPPMLPRRAWKSNCLGKGPWRRHFLG